jgi:hypothetical protein
MLDSVLNIVANKIYVYCLIKHTIILLLLFLSKKRKQENKKPKAKIKKQNM